MNTWFHRHFSFGQRLNVTSGWVVSVRSVVLMLVACGPATAADLDEIVRDWESIAADSPILHYRMTGERTTFANAYDVLDENMSPTSKSFPSEPVSHPYVQEILIDPGSDRIRVSFERHIPRDDGHFSHRRETATLLRGKASIYKPTRGNGSDPDAVKKPRPFNVEYTVNGTRSPGLWTEATYWAILYAHGHFTFLLDEIDDLKDLRDRFNLQDAGTVETDDGRLVVVRFDQERPGTTSTTELHLNPGRRHRVQRARKFVGETLVSDTELSYTDFDSGSFQVASIRGKKFYFIDGRPIDECRCNCEIAKTLASVPDSRFRLEIPAGAWVRDAAADKVFQWNPPPPEWYESKLLWVVVFVVLVIFLGVFARRRSYR